MKRLLGSLAFLNVLIIAFLIVWGCCLDRFLLHPKVLPADYVFSLEHPFEEFWIEQNDGARINGIWVKQAQSRGLILYFHGNADNLQRWAQHIGDFTPLDYDVMMIDYRGFGKSIGDLDEAALHADALASYQFARKHYAAEEIVIYGRSLGSGVATQLAASVPCSMLILETPFFNVPDVVHRYQPFFRGEIPGSYRLRSDLFIPWVKAPIHIFHGTEDRAVPYSEGYRFVKLLGEAVHFVTIDGGGHKNLAEFESYHRELKRMLKPDS